LFGVTRIGQLRATQASHDLAMMSLLMHVSKQDPLARDWYGEDWVSENVPGIQGYGEKLPDAFLIVDGRIVRGIGLAGADYDKARLLGFVRWAEAKGYEFQVF